MKDPKKQLTLGNHWIMLSQLQIEIRIKQNYDLIDRKQDPIGMYQESKNTCFRPKIDHERSKKCS